MRRCCTLSCRCTSQSTVSSIFLQVRRTRSRFQPRRLSPHLTDHWLHGFNYNVEEWDAEGQHYETLAICRSLALARAAFKEAVAEKPAGQFMIRTRTRGVKRWPEGDW